MVIILWKKYIVNMLKVLSKVTKMIIRSTDNKFLQWKFKFRLLTHRRKGREILRLPLTSKWSVSISRVGPVSPRKDIQMSLVLEILIFKTTENCNQYNKAISLPPKLATITILSHFVPIVKKKSECMIKIRIISKGLQ